MDSTHLFFFFILKSFQCFVFNFNISFWMTEWEGVMSKCKQSIESSSFFLFCAPFSVLCTREHRGNWNTHNYYVFSLTRTLLNISVLNFCCCCRVFSLCFPLVNIAYYSLTSACCVFRIFWKWQFIFKLGALQTLHTVLCKSTF